LIEVIFVDLAAKHGLRISYRPMPTERLIGRGARGVIVGCAALLLALALGACGAPDRKEMYATEVRQADAKYVSESDEVGRARTGGETLKRIELAAASFERIASGLDGIKPPSEVAAAHRQLVRGYRQLAVDFRQLAALARRGQLGGEDKLGLDELHLAFETSAEDFPGIRIVLRAEDRMSAKGYDVNSVRR
jgi:hypothetical protein